MEIQQQVRELVKQESILKAKITNSIAMLNNFRNSLITEAVTGQLDIVQWKKRGLTNKRLDKMQEAIAS